MTKEDLEMYALQNILESDSVEGFEKMQQWIEGALWMQEQLKNCNLQNVNNNEVVVCDCAMPSRDADNECCNICGKLLYDESQTDC